MEQYIYFSKESWLKFVDFAFNVSDEFSLAAYDDFHGHIKQVTFDYFLFQLNQWLIVKDFASCTYSCIDLDIYHFNCNYFTKKIFSQAGYIDNFHYPKYPMDPSFYFQGKMWFRSVVHDGVFAIETECTDIYKSYCQLFQE